jgi:hypothetical protein
MMKFIEYKANGIRPGVGHGSFVGRMGHLSQSKFTAIQNI